MVTQIRSWLDYDALTAALDRREAFLASLARGEFHADNFVVKNGRTHYVRRWYPSILLDEIANFVAAVAAEGRDFRDRHCFHVVGVDQEGRPLPPVTVLAPKFSALNWVVEHWGTAAVVTAGKRPRMAEAILRLSAAVPDLVSASSVSRPEDGR
jgi:hypothetical protein